MTRSDDSNAVTVEVCVGGSCTVLTPPGSFAPGDLYFEAPSPISVDARTVVQVVLKKSGSSLKRIGYAPAYQSDSSGLDSGWRFDGNGQIYRSGSWIDRNYRLYVAVLGTINE